MDSKLKSLNQSFNEAVTILSTFIIGNLSVEYSISSNKQTTSGFKVKVTTLSLYSHTKFESSVKYNLKEIHELIRIHLYQNTYHQLASYMAHLIFSLESTN